MRKFARMAGSYCCRNDQNLTFMEDVTGLVEILGYSIEEIRADYKNCLLEFVVAEERCKLMQSLSEQLSEGDDITLAFSALKKDGKIAGILNRGRRIIGVDGQEYIQGILVDITQSKSTYDSQIKTLDKYQIILSQTENIIFEWDYIADTMFFSNTWESIFGYTPQTEKFSTVFELEPPFYPGDGKRLEAQLLKIREGASYQIVEVRIARADGNYLWCRVRATGVYDETGALCKIVGIIIDVDAEKKAAYALQQQAERDSLTKLFNAHTTRKKTEEYLSMAEDRADCALMIIDLDNFKQVNDRFGHMFGDMVLAQAAKTIKKLFRSHDIVGRIGGDEFMVLMKDVSDRELVNKRCSQMIAAFHDIFYNQMYGCELSCSIGVSFSPMHGYVYYDLFRCADQALYQAKNLGKNQYAFYNSESFLSADEYCTAITEERAKEKTSFHNGNFLLYVFQHLYEATDIEKSIFEMLEMIGRQMDISRAYVIEAKTESGEKHNIFEWCNADIEASEDILHAELSGTVAMRESRFDNQGIFWCKDICTLPKDMYDYFAGRKVKSVLQFAIRDAGIFYGYIGFEECIASCPWTNEQVNTLLVFSKILTVFLMKKRV